MKVSHNHPRFTRWLAAAAVMAIAAPAVAQDTSAGANEGDIIVTATKRAEALQDVPIAVSVLSSEDLESRNVQGYEDYLTSVPGVQFNYGGNQYTNSISIRGVTDLSGSSLTQTPVAIYLDETPLTLSQGSFNIDYSIFGVEQINVIKGPHSTLYGAASLGGTIKVVTRKPSVTDAYYAANVDVHTVRKGDIGYSVAGSVGIPILNGKGGVEVTAYYKKLPGFIDEPSQGAKDINDGETNGARFALRLVPSERLTVDATIYYQNHKKNGLDVFAPNQVGDLQSRPLATPQGEKDRFWMASLVIDYDMDFANLVSATSYYERKANVAVDLSQSFFNLGIPGATASSLLSSPTEVLSEELRLVSQGSGPLKWLIGGFYSREKYTEISDLSNSIAGPLFSGPLNYDYETLAGFGEVTYAFVPDLELTLGARYTKYTADTFINLTGAFALPGPPVDRRDSETDFSPRAALNYRFGDSSVYIQAAKGFRLGQANVPIVSLPGENPPVFFESDSLWNYEVGTKLSLLDRKLNLNMAAFFIDWKNPQVTLASGSGFTYIDNAGAVEIKGAELELVARPADKTVATLGVAYNDAKLSEALPGVAPKGFRLPGVPEWTLNASLQQGFMMGGSEAFARVDYLYYGPYDDAFPAFGVPSPENGDYHKLDLRVGVDVGAAQVQVYVTNVLDERPILTREFAYGGEDFSTIRPRTIGASVGFKF